MANNTETTMRDVVIELRAKLAEANALVEWLRQRNDALAAFAESQAQRLQDIEAVQRDTPTEAAEETG
ncbi:MAG: eIF3 subunit 6 N terminal domain [Rhodobacteraceae bacterium HLUCCA12]|nr:MAG: eIF3 subunit 6 N terminal domain [Rhodobacteraceae bacterium HLUCCA12]